MRSFTGCEISVPLGNRRITQEKLCKEIGAWRAEEKAYEKSILPVSIYEDYTKSWSAMRAKAWCNSEIFPTYMIIQTVGFLAEAFSSVFLCVSCAFILLLVIFVQLDLAQIFLSLHKFIVEVG